MVVRTRLLESLQVLKPLTLVCAPAGYGKTVLVDSWSATAPEVGTTVWLTLEDEASDARRFWETLVVTLQENHLRVSAAQRRSTVHEDLGPLARLIAGRPGGVTLVLDCDEFSLSPSVGAGLDRLVRRCRGALRLILLTREDPPLALHRHRLEGALTDLRAADLSFTTDEIDLLMRSQGLELQAADVSLLRARTGGWPAGLRFAGMTITDSRGAAKALDDFRGDAGNVAEYLLSEVLRKQDEDYRQFLLRTCVADELEPELVEALWGRPCDLQLLQSMARGNAFIELVPGHPDRYRYQLLFREFLRGQLAYEAPELVGALHRAAADWLAQDGRVYAGIRHAAMAGEWPTATSLLVERLGFVSLLVGWKNERLAALLGAMPPEVPGATAAITRAVLSVSELDLECGERHLDEAYGLLADDSEPVPPTHTLAVAVLTAILASLGTDTEAGLRAALVAEKALRMTSTRDLDALLELSAVISGCKARVLFERGALDEASSALSDGLQAAGTGRLDGLMAELRGMAALVEAASGRLRRATDFALRVMPGVNDPDEPVVGPGLAAAALALAWVRTDESGARTPRELLWHGDHRFTSYDSRVLDAVLTLLRARALEREGHAELALAELHGADDRFSRTDLAAPVTGWLAEQLTVAEATSLLGLARRDEAATLLQDVDPPKHAAGGLELYRALVAVGVEPPATRPLVPVDDAPPAVQVDSLLLLAEESLEEHAPARAAESLDRALKVAAPERLRRPFLESGERLRALLDSTGLTRSNGWLGAPAGPDTHDAPAGPVRSEVPAQRVTSVDGPQGPLVVIPLTAKETEVLGHLAALLTTDEIAATMFVSVNTVRSHVRSILRKLGANRRNEAVRRAWEIGILAPDDSFPSSAAR